MPDTNIIWVHGSSLVDATVGEEKAYSDADFIIFRKSSAGTELTTKESRALQDGWFVILPLVVPARVEDDRQKTHSVRLVGMTDKGGAIEKIEIIETNVDTLKERLVGLANSHQIRSGPDGKIDITLPAGVEAPDLASPPDAGFRPGVPQLIHGPLVARFTITLERNHESKVTIVGGGLVTIDD